MNDRAADIWEPLLALADPAGGEWPELAKQAALGLSASAQENSPIGSLLFSIWFVLTTTGVERMFSRTLVEALNSMADRPRGAMRNGKGITEAWLAEQLRPYDIRLRTVRIGNQVTRGYLGEDFDEVFRRYIPRSEMEALRAGLEEAIKTHKAESSSSPETKEHNPNGVGSESKSEARAVLGDDAAVV